MSLTSTPTGFAVTDAGTGQPVISTGTTTSLALAFVNNSDGDVALPTGAKPATFAVYLPSNLFTLDQLKRMQVSTPGWQLKVDPDDQSLNVTCAQAGLWAKDATLTLTITNVVSAGPPVGGSVTVGPSNMTGKVSREVHAPLAVANPPTPGSLPLPDALQVSLDDRGSVYRSSSADPLTNTLFLNLKNVGKDALATGGSSRPGTPQIVVSFVYGNTSGALAPEDRVGGKAPKGSAWNIKIAMGPAQTLWTATNPRPESNLQHPEWVLEPSSTNRTILGPSGSDQANVSFAFEELLAFTPAGHTQMLVVCTGFRKDANTKYDDHVYVLDIVKQDPPPTRGLLAFSSQQPVVAVADPKAKLEIPLRWTMLDVGSVQLLSSVASVPPMTRRYPNPKPLDYDSATLTLPPLRTSEAIFVTLQAFDGAGAFLNSLQFTVYAQLGYVVDPGGSVYDIRLFGDTFWMLRNYHFDAYGSYLYGDLPENEQPYGRLYDWNAAQAHIPDGWALPTLDDWNALIAVCGGEQQAFAQLTGNGFSAQLGGLRRLDPDGKSGTYDDMYRDGYYWASEGHAYAQFSGDSGSVSTGGTFDPGTALSVRYVRHV